MVIRRRRIAKLLAAIAAWLAASPLWAAESAKLSAERLFVEQVRPLLSEKCLACHGGKPDDIAVVVAVAVENGPLADEEPIKAKL